ncbi:spectrin beta chain [Caerostris extrusa]|uniref:Spectrin beta chain n=1 Tax=Caerostris extrusa TaxID=172846 RepID=A0AAV4W1H8_CAEEX|nr:spectrin beta chain [Caerostris extrusa]
MISDINRAWESLEKAEHERELALRDELIRQEKLEQLAARFDRKSGLRETWLKVKIRDLSPKIILSRLLTEDSGKHLMGVVDLLQKHSLIEADINVLGENVKVVIQHLQSFLDTKSKGGYQVCDPQYIQERIKQLEAAYIELVQLASDRHNHLIESRKLWQFFWDMAEEEAWIKEKERILSSGDIGHDLTAIHLLISKNKAAEDEISNQSKQIQALVQTGEDLIAANHFSSDSIRERINEIQTMLANLSKLQQQRMKRLTDAVDYHQFFTDADDVDTWMLDTLRLVSSEDIGRDEANDTTEDLKNFASTIDALHQQAAALGDEDRTAPDVLDRLSSIDRRYKELVELAKLRKQRLLDALSLYKLFNEADGIKQWILEKEKNVGLYGHEQ